MMIKSKYDWKKTLVKVGIATGEVILASLVIYFTDNAFCLFLIPVIEGARNWLIHWRK